MPDVDLGTLLGSWELALRAERKSAQTVKSCGDGVRRFLAWCDAAGTPPVLDRPTVAFIAELIDEGVEPASARARQLSLRRFSAWLAEEGEIYHDQLLGIKPPKLDVKIVEPLTDDDLRALIKACSGLARFRDRRDEAIIRVMLETGLRAGELVEMTISDTNLTAGEAIVRRGKGGKGRIIPLGAQSVRALDRYIRARRAHRLADTDALWLRDRGKAFSYYGLHRTLRMRADVAGVVNFHPHRLRHTAAHRWPAAGGSEGGLMSVAAGPARTCSCATRKPRPRSAPLPKRGS